MDTKDPRALIQRARELHEIAGDEWIAKGNAVLTTTEWVVADYDTAPTVEEAIVIAEARNMVDPLADIAEQALARAEKAEQARTWRPIQTAPQDGTQILAWTSGSCLVRHMVWGVVGMVEGWRLVGGKDIYTPTHWMPLPDAPKETP